MSKNNDHKKVYDIDEFARHYYCQVARLRQLREDKHRAKKKARSERKRITGQEEDDYNFGKEN